MTIYKIAKDCIENSTYQSEVSLQRAIVKYIDNCLSNFGCSIEDFKNKDDKNNFFINSELETIIKSYVSRRKKFPNISQFEKWKDNPTCHQNKVDETIIVVKSFLDHNFNDGTYKKQREIIKKNLEEVYNIIEETNKTNEKHQYSVYLNISNFTTLIIMSNEELEEYFSMVYCAYKSLSYNETPSFDIHERMLLEYIQYANNIQKLVYSLKSEHILDYCTRRNF